MSQRLTAVAFVMVLLAVWTHARPRADGSAPFDFAGAVPLAFGSWIGRDAPPLDPDTAKVLAADQYVHRYYGIRGLRMADRGRRADVEMDIAYYTQPQAGGAMHSPLNCLPGTGWQMIDSGTTELPVGREPVRVRELVVARGADRVAMTYWFQNRGMVVGNEYRQRLQLLANGLQGRPADAALIRVMALDTPEGRGAMGQFARALAARLHGMFR